jgi:hypothetical protein
MWFKFLTHIFSEQLKHLWDAGKGKEEREKRLVWLWPANNKYQGKENVGKNQKAKIKVNFLEQEALFPIWKRKAIVKNLRL